MAGDVVAGAGQPAGSERPVGAQAVYVGSYTTGAGGDGAGITRWWRDSGSGRIQGGEVAAELASPSFLTLHPRLPVLYAVSETDDGQVAAFALETGGGLRALGAQPTGGSFPCHLAVAGDGRWLVSANYGSGSVAVHPIGPDGGLGARAALIQHEGTGPDAERQEGPHAHMVQVDPAGTRFLITDLGTDELRAYTFGDDGDRPHLTGMVKLPAGSGPRHLAAHPDGERLFLVGELDSTVMVLVRDGDSLRLADQRPATATPDPDGDGGVPNYPSGVRCSTDGRWVYVANRGRDCVSVFTVAGEKLEPVTDVACGGRWPRDLILVGEGTPAAQLLVANQQSDRVVVFPLDPATGVPTPAGDDLQVPSPACILPIPDGRLPW